jgi:hypothetical protein
MPRGLPGVGPQCFGDWTVEGDALLPLDAIPKVLDFLTAGLESGAAVGGIVRGGQRHATLEGARTSL